MSRLIFFFAIISVVYLLIKSYSKKSTLQSPAHDEKMVCCAHCGLYLPEKESIRAGEVSFCCAEHRDLQQKSRAS